MLKEREGFETQVRELEERVCVCVCVCKMHIEGFETQVRELEERLWASYTSSLRPLKASYTSSLRPPKQVRELEERLWASVQGNKSEIRRREQVESSEQAPIHQLPHTCSMRTHVVV